MARAKWNSALETGNLLVDGEHRHLFELINSLHDAIVAKADREQQEQLIFSIIEHVTAHFSHEEALMEETHFPGLRHQRVLHKEFMKKSRALVDEYLSGAVSLPITLELYLYDWLVTHVRTEDRLIGEHIRNSSASQ
jgi:hemerythrin-like metal-binding protein